MSAARTRVAALAAVTLATVATAVPATAHAAGPGPRHHRHLVVTETDLVADRPGVAAVTDPNLVNPWGLSSGPATPIWVSDNGADVSTLYRGGDAMTPVSPVPLVVSIPGGAPTGQAFNDTTAFVVPGTGAPAHFLFAGENGDLSAWNAGTSAVAVGHTDDAVYKGLALVHSPFGPLLLATDFHHGRVDVFDAGFARLDVPLLFRDPYLPRGYAPFGVTTVGDQVLVSYARQDAAGHDDVPGRGHGFVDVFTDYGAFVHRLISRGALDSPWGMAIAPSGWGRLTGKLLVGNFGDGRITAYDPRTGHEIGQLRDRYGHRLVIDGLWGLLPGNPAAGGTDAIWFSAGPDGEQHGLLGTLTRS